MRSWMTDVIVTISMLAVAAAFGYLYYENVNRQVTESGLTPVGTLVYKHHVAQRRFANRAIWQQIAGGMPLYNLNSVRTAGGSEAVVHLNDGTKIEMGPNSLITLDWTVKTKSIDFLSGSITAIRTRPIGASANVRRTSPGAASGTVVIRSGRSAVDLSRATVTLAHTGTGHLDVSVASGEASLSVGKTVKTISSGQVAHVNTRGGTATVTRTRLMTVTPVADAVFVTQTGSIPVLFSWKARSGSVATVDLSSSARFTSGVRSYHSATGSLGVTLAPGVYYWKVDTPSAAGAPERFTVLRDGLVRPQVPAAGSFYTYETQAPRITFRWRGTAHASGYALEIAKTKRFVHPAYERKTTTTAIDVGSLARGTYYWRVTPLYSYAESSKTVAEPAVAFGIARRPKLVSPTLVAPANKGKITTEAIDSSGLLFNWEQVRSIAKWTLTIARNRRLSNIVRRKTTVDNFFVQGRLAPGVYYWQVHGVDTTGRPAPPSAVRTFTVRPRHATITLKSPRANWAYDGSTFASVPVVWSSDLLGTFKVQLSTTADFSALYEQKETSFDNTIFGSVPPGTYFWRVLLLNRYGATVVTSGSESFTVLPPLVAPVPTVPAAGAGLKLINAKHLVFRWDGDPRSRYYDFTLYGPGRGGAQSIITRARNLTTNDFSMTDLRKLVAGGHYTWAVLAHNPAGPNLSAQTSPPTLAKFVVAKLLFIPAPELVSPSAGERIAGVTAVDRGVSFSWVRSDPLGSAVVEVATDPSFTRHLRRISVGKDTSTVSLPELLPGTYYWRVKAHTRQGIASPPSTVDEFTVTTLPPLPRPARLAPKPGETVDMWDKRALAFSWSPVAHASSYTIRLENLSTGKTVLSVSGLTRSSYRFTSLAKLNVGPFAWTIQAVQVDRNGRTVRLSTPLTVRFAIALGKTIGPANIKSASRYFVH